MEKQESFQDIDDGEDNDKDSNDDDDNNGDDDNKINNHDDDDDDDDGGGGGGGGSGGDWSFSCFSITAMVMLLHDVIPLDVNIIAVLLLRHTSTCGLSSRLALYTQQLHFHAVT